MKSKEQIIDMAKNGKYFCILPWIHLYVTGQADMKPCCESTRRYGNLCKDSLKDLWQGQAIRDFRLKMLNDEMDVNCTSCYENDKVGITSIRKLCNMDFCEYAEWVANTDECGYAYNAKPIYWDIRFSNKCNLSCRTCSPQFSTGWYKDVLAIANELKECELHDCNPGIKKRFEASLDYTKKLLLDLEEYFPYVVKIYSAGGDPLIIKDNLLILEKLNSIRKNDTDLIYNTNLTQLHKNSEYLPYFKRQEKFTVLVSMDGSHERGEYIRKGMKWDSVIDNLNILKQECPHAYIIINFTVSAFNILHLPDFHKEIVEKGYLRADQINLNMLHNSVIYNCKILPKELKEKATNNIYEHITWLEQQISNTENLYHYDRSNIADQWYACINHMNSEDWTHLIPIFLKSANKLDKLRNEKLLDVFPELELLVNY
jgi:Predicted Fe-S oxidoreductases